MGNVTIAFFCSTVLCDLGVLQEGFGGGVDVLFGEKFVDLWCVEVAGLQGSTFLHPEAELRDEGVAFDCVVDCEACDDEDVTVAGIEGIGQIGSQFMKLTPGVDVCHAPVRIC